MHDEVENPLRVKVGTRGPEWGPELVVATPIELCGRGRPRVLYDVTLALKMLDICIFKVDPWTLYLFFLVICSQCNDVDASILHLCWNSEDLLQLVLGFQEVLIL